MSIPAGRSRAIWYLMPSVAVVSAAAIAIALINPVPGADGGRGRSPGPTGSTAPAKCEAPSSTAGLRELAARCGIDVGAAVSGQLFDDATYRDTVAHEYNSVTPESAMKWGTVEAAPGQFNFAPGDAFVDAAERNDQRVRGHTLVWHVLPTWVTRSGFGPARLRETLQRHIESTVTHWRGRVDSWDVVNEPINGDGTLRDSVWLDGLGPGYIADAFRWARAADPDATLYLNDFGIEGFNPKSDRLYELVKDLRAQGVPIDGVGFQTHVFDMNLPSTFESNLRRFAELGVRIAITEFDVRLPLPATPDLLQKQAQIYGRALRACLHVPACESFTTWGFTDLHSWGDRVHPNTGAALPFDRAYQPKPAYWALRDTLAIAAPRRAAR